MKKHYKMMITVLMILAVILSAFGSSVSAAASDDAESLDKLRAFACTENAEWDVTQDDVYIIRYTILSNGYIMARYGVAGFNYADVNSSFTIGDYQFTMPDSAPYLLFDGTRSVPLEEHEELFEELSADGWCKKLVAETEAATESSEGATTEPTAAATLDQVAASPQSGVSVGNTSTGNTAAVKTGADRAALIVAGSALTAGVFLALLIYRRKKQM